ncbi:hypothetical protein DRQ15_10515, partial [candidate division KSB1 bacterium]
RLGWPRKPSCLLYQGSDRACSPQRFPSRTSGPDPPTPAGPVSSPAPSSSPRDVAPPISPREVETIA